LPDFCRLPVGKLYHVRHVSNSGEVWQSISIAPAFEAASLATGGLLLTVYS
tara:strand:- start:142 stop:294 length:153 start_codon:yes stop_codon:yes gene_type:complete